MDTALIATIITLILTAISAAAGSKYVHAQNKASQLTDIINSIISAAKDNTVTEAEFQTIIDKIHTALEKT